MLLSFVLLITGCHFLCWRWLACEWFWWKWNRSSLPT